MVDPEAERISSLPGLSNIELRELWKQTFKSVAPPTMRKDLMIPILAYKIQEQAFRSLTAASRSRLRRLARLFESDSSAAVIAVPGATCCGNACGLVFATRNLKAKDWDGLRCIDSRRRRLQASDAKESASTYRSGNSRRSTTLRSSLHTRFVPNS